MHIRYLFSEGFEINVADDHQFVISGQRTFEATSTRTRTYAQHYECNLCRNITRARTVISAKICTVYNVYINLVSERVYAFSKSARLYLHSVCAR